MKAREGLRLSGNSGRRESRIGEEGIEGELK